MAHAARRYWDALAAKDPVAMAACYADDATFEDPVFSLQGAEIGKMWIGLFSGAKDLKIDVEALDIDGDEAVGVWRATYTFSRTGRIVHNVIRSRIQVEDDRIIAHQDWFPFWKWSRMALGAPGYLLGWTPIVRNKVRKMAETALKAKS